MERGVAIRPSNSTSKDMLKRTENVCLYKNWFIHVHSSIIPNSLKRERTPRTLSE